MLAPLSACETRIIRATILPHRLLLLIAVIPFSYRQAIARTDGGRTVAALVWISRGYVRLAA